MKRKKKLRTQKQRALRLGAWVLALAVFAVLSGTFTPLPQTLIRRSEAALSCGETQLVRKERVDGHRICLTANDHALLLTSGDFRPLMGWEIDLRNHLDLSRAEGQVAVEVMRTSPDRIRAGEEDTLTTHYFGLVRTEGAVTVRVHFPWVEEAQPLDIPTFRGKDGRTYFWGWLVIPFYGPQGYDKDAYSEPLVVEALDETGRVLATGVHPAHYDP